LAFHTDTNLVGRQRDLTAGAPLTLQIKSNFFRTWAWVDAQIFSSNFLCVSFPGPFENHEAGPYRVLIHSFYAHEFPSSSELSEKFLFFLSSLPPLASLEGRTEEGPSSGWHTQTTLLYMPPLSTSNLLCPTILTTSCPHHVHEPLNDCTD